MDASDEMKRKYASLVEMRKTMETMKKNQALRGPENLALRLAERARTHKSWRQMKGWDSVKFELYHPGNRFFVIGYIVTIGIAAKLYKDAINSEEAKAESKFWYYLQKIESKKEGAHNHH